MANPSIYAAFERMWQHITAKLGTKADKADIVQVDWNQNDETVLDYVKNRTHYEGVITSDTLTWDGNTEGKIGVNDMFYLVSENALTFEDFANGATVTYIYPSGDIIQQEWTSDRIDVRDNGSFELAGQQVIVIPESAAGTNGPYSDTFFEKAGVYFTKMYNGIYTSALTINGYSFETPYIRTIDPKFLPAHSWNDLEDKPFHEETKEIKTMYKTTCVIEENEFGIIPAEVYCWEDLVAGETYVVNFDSVEYTCTARYFDNIDSPDDSAIIIGDTTGTEYEDGLGNGEPFCYYITKTHLSYLISSVGTHTISISQFETSIKKLDPKFLPDNIGSDGSGIYVQETEPESPSVGDIWVDTSVGIATEAQPLSILQGGTGATTIEEARANLGIAPAFSSGETILSSYQYGDTLPEEATEGRIFFKRKKLKVKLNILERQHMVQKRLNV